jgi:hypothetical protein
MIEHHHIKKKQKMNRSNADFGAFHDPKKHRFPLKTLCKKPGQPRLIFWA